jgi:hypothetical protein
MSEEDTPQDLLLQRALPLMNKVIQDGFKAQQEMIRTLQLQNEQLLKQLADLTLGRAPVRVTVDFSEGSSTTVASSDHPTPMDVDPVSSSNISQQQQITTSASDAVVSHAWSRGVVTIPDLWREYSVGLGGGYSIKSLNSSHPHWFLPHDKNFHYRRMRIINGLEKHAILRGITIETCIQHAENNRILLKKSLYSLGKATDSINALLT